MTPISPVVALRKAMRAYVFDDEAIVAALGGEKLFDDAPRGTEPPYALFAETQLRDWSADQSPGAEQFITLAVVSTARGFATALAIAEKIARRLDEAELTLQGHHLVDLRFLSMETRRDQNGRFARVNLRFRALTEAL